MARCKSVHKAAAKQALAAVLSLDAKFSEPEQARRTLKESG